MKDYDFSGWATKNNLRCSDGRTIMKDAFIGNNGGRVPLVWNHQHNDPDNVLGHADLENREEGVYLYGKFNDTERGQTAKMLVQHGDVKALSIFANQLKEQGKNVLHGNIREVSLVLAGANPGAFIDMVIAHSDDEDGSAVIYTGENLSLDAEEKIEHVDKAPTEETKKEDEKPVAENKKTVQDVFDTLNEEQKTVVYALIAQAIKDNAKDDGEKAENEEEKPVKHNVFDNDSQENTNVLSHSDMEAIIRDAKRCGSLKQSAIEHDAADVAYIQHDGEQTYGIKNVDYLFPEARNLNVPPDFISREMTWVGQVMGAVHHTPFSRIKSMFADITEDAARAKGYIKGKLKKEEVFGLLKRSTNPTTIYKKQKMDRDDVVDITDFDVIAWIKKEMRVMLDEEIARAILFGDGRLTSDDDHIDANCIRPVWTDADLYTIKALFETTSSMTEDQEARTFIKTCIKARKNYKGSGTPAMYIEEDMLTKCLLIEDMNGRIIYDSVDKLATTLRVSKIIPVELMENQTRTVEGKTHTLHALIVNLSDYNVGADKGGAVAMFDDFDIDYNQQKYLIETRCSGALIKPFSAIAVESTPAA